VPQQSAEVFLALDRTTRVWNRFGLVARGHRQGPIIPSLVRTKPIVKRLVTFYDVTEMVDAEAHEMIQQFHFDRLHKPLGEGVDVGFPRPRCP
jgi:hypothetical protein